jgi:hypothetical protein
MFSNSLERHVLRVLAIQFQNNYKKEGLGIFLIMPSVQLGFLVKYTFSGPLLNTLSPVFRACQETSTIVVNSSRKKKKFVFTSTCKYCPHMPSNSIKCKGNLGKIIPVALKYLIYAMQNVPVGHPRPTGVI